MDRRLAIGGHDPDLRVDRRGLRTRKQPLATLALIRKSGGVVLRRRYRLYTASAEALPSRRLARRTVIRRRFSL